MECPDGPRDCCLCLTGQNVVSSPAGAGGRHRDAHVLCGFVSWGGGAGHSGSSLDPGPSRGSGDTECSKGVLLRVQSHWATWEMCRKDAGANTHRLLFCFLPNRAARCGSAGCTRSSSARCPSWVSGSRRERPHVRPARAPAAGPATALSALPVWPVGSVFSGLGEFGRHTCSAHTCTPAGVHMHTTEARAHAHMYTRVRTCTNTHCPWSEPSPLCPSPGHQRSFITQCPCRPLVCSAGPSLRPPPVSLPPALLPAGQF